MSGSARGPDSIAMPIAVVIATKDDQAGAARAAASVLESSYPAIELCIVDQTNRALTPDLQRLENDDRVCVAKALPKGLAAARNVGVRLTRAPIIAFTDDDCEVEPGWLEAIVAVFNQDQRMGVVFGSVRAASYDQSAGFIQAYAVTEPTVARSVSAQATICGIGACMAIRRSVFDVVHGFDEHLGAGTALRAAEDSDIVGRILLAGFWVAETPDAVVTHHGFRSWVEGRATIKGYMRGLGASHAKLLRIGGPRATRPILSLAWRWLARRPAVDLNHRPPRLMRLRAFLGGAWSGLRLSVDPATGHFSHGLEAEAPRR